MLSACIALICSLVLLHNKVVEASGVSTVDFDLNRDSCPQTPFNNSDFLLLVHSNQVTFCGSKGSACNSSFVENLFDDQVFFTIHGMWPQLEHPIDKHAWPQCCASDPFEESELGALKPTMENHAWPMVTSFALWQHEWEKHGTCALYARPAIPYIRSQYDYFKSAVDLYFKANINKMLVNANILPNDDKPVNVGYLNSVFQSNYGVEPIISYYDDHRTHHKLISEVWMCVSKETMTFMKCPSTLKTSHQAYPHDDLVVPTKFHLRK